DLLQAGRPDYLTETVQARFFRRDAGARYLGRLHPSSAVPLNELARRQGQKAYPPALPVRRPGYLAAPPPDKLRWGRTVLEPEVTATAGASTPTAWGPWPC